jgi:hypothetical protein
MTSFSDEVGYGKPPKSGQFRKGQSGNPKGRPKGSKNIATILHAIMHELINVKDNGRVKTMIKGEAMMRQMVSKALSGDLKATKEILNWNHIFQEAAERDMVKAPDLARDEEVVKNFLNRMDQFVDETTETLSMTKTIEKDEK